MTTAVLIGLFGVLIISAAVSKTNTWLWFLAGATLLGLGVWWMHDPIVDSGDPVNDVMLVIAIIGGIGLMLVGLGWRTRTVNGSEVGGFNIRLPSFLGGVSEEEEQERRNMGNLQYRNESYRKLLSDASKGIRRR